MVLGFLSVAVYFTLRAQTRETPDNPSTPAAARVDTREDKSTYPIVDLANENSADPGRRAKGRKFNRIEVINPDATASSVETTILHWERGLTALPVEKSDVVVVGKIEEADAYLSENNLSIYSEFRIAVEEVFKNATSKAIRVGDVVLAERPGGIFRKPSGIETWFRIEGQRMPITNGRYLLFLNFELPLLPIQKDDLLILTAYRLDGVGIEPLDSPGDGTHPLASRYRGVDKSVLMRDLRSALPRPQR
jgi:hypothetical protein